VEHARSKVPTNVTLTVTEREKFYLEEPVAFEIPLLDKWSSRGAKCFSEKIQG
jgi:hypothetical protein